MDRNEKSKLPGLRSDRGRFVDERGREVLLRGINLGGDCKLPYPDGGMQHPSDFADHRTVSFVGRPFPLSEAREHFARIAGWGFNCLRLLTTWEAVEHAGPGQYDRAYIEYYAELCRLAGEYGFYVFVDFHQDVWSRMSGGDGAPGWVFERAGLDFTKFDEADAAIVMQHRFDYGDARDRQPENYPTMCWSQNYMYPANAIMWTLFFAGRDFAPDCLIDGENVQDFLQKSYLGAMREIAVSVADQTHVIGFDSLNEPSSGWIGRPFARRILRDTPDIIARPGYAMSPRDGLRLARGESVAVEFLDISWWRGRLHPARRDTLNRNGVSIWLPGRGDPFGFETGTGSRAAVEDAQELPEDYFQRVDGREVDFDRDYLFPFVTRVAECVREIRPDWLIFAEKDAFETMSHPDWPADAPIPVGCVNAGHWYDGLSLLLKKYPFPISFDVIYGRPSVGRSGIRAMYVRQLRRIQAASDALGIPTLIGEFGIQYDLDQARAYGQYAVGCRDDTIWKKHTLALELMYDALDELRLNSTQWNYTASNSNHARSGDGWNQEDLSVYSRDQHEMHDGGRAVHGFVRPYPRAVQGELVRTRFDRRRARYELRFIPETDLAHTTEIFVPRLQFPNGFEALLNGRRVLAVHGSDIVAEYGAEPPPDESGCRARFDFDPEAQLLQLRMIAATPGATTPSDRQIELVLQATKAAS